MAIVAPFLALCSKHDVTQNLHQCLYVRYSVYSV